MQRHIRIQISGPNGSSGGNGGPGILARIFVAILAVIMLVAAAFLGAIFFLAALGIFVVGSVVLVTRIWWARRQFQKAIKRGDYPGSGRADRAGQPDNTDIIDGEFHVMDENSSPQGRDRSRERDRNTPGDR